MKLFYLYSNKFEKHKKNFIDNLKDPFELVEIPCDNPDKDPDGGDISTYGGGKKFGIYRTNTLIDALKKEKEPFIFSDIDIVFYNRIQPIIDSMLKESDIIFQREYFHSDVNIGFMAMHPVRVNIDFWTFIKSEVEKNKWDQQAVNEALKSNKFPNLRWARFPETVWAMSIGIEHLSDKIILHHANCTVGEDKFEQFKYIKELLKNKNPIQIK